MLQEGDKMDNNQKYLETTKKINNQFIISCGFLVVSGLCFYSGKFFWDAFIFIGFIFLIISIAMFLFCLWSLFKNRKEPKTMNTVMKLVMGYVFIAFVMFVSVSFPGN